MQNCSNKKVRMKVNRNRNTAVTNNYNSSSGINKRRDRRNRRRRIARLNQRRLALLNSNSNSNSNSNPNNSGNAFNGNTPPSFQFNHPFSHQPSFNFNGNNVQNTHPPFIPQQLNNVNGQMLHSQPPQYIPPNSGGGLGIEFEQMLRRIVNETVTRIVGENQMRQVSNILFMSTISANLKPLSFIHILCWFFLSLFVENVKSKQTAHHRQAPYRIFHCAAVYFLTVHKNGCKYKNMLRYLVMTRTAINLSIFSQCSIQIVCWRYMVSGHM